MPSELKLGDVMVEVVLKDIKNVHLSVHPPTGRVTIAAPSRMSLDTIRVFAISKLGWIRRQQKSFRDQERETPREYIERESHYVWGNRYLLKIIEEEAAPAIRLTQRHMTLRLRPGASEADRHAIVAHWYRQQLRSALPALQRKWEPVIGVSVNKLFVQRMRTKWGSCNPISRNIRLNTDLAKKPPECLEYIMVHEMTHLLVRHHGEQFLGLIDRFLPNWRTVRQQLNELPLAHADWQ